ncbi:MAG: hypothetical protein JNL57_07965 [Bacteroidetes bacterium]|nr:hypothetical protein [Bacteroidota bacterium]
MTRDRLLPVVCAGLFCLMGAGCKKKNSNTPNLPPVYTPTLLESLFESMILNRQTIIQQANDSAGTDITNSYTGYIFMLKKNTYHDGPFVCTTPDSTFTGTWSCNADYSQMLLHLTGKPEFENFNIYWKFKSKSNTKIELLPWFSFQGNRYLRIVPK